MVKFLYRCYFLPYARLHKHRGSSHWPILGTAIRIIYLNLPTIAVILYFDLDLARLPPSVWTFLLWAAAGLCVSDAAHWFMDVLS